MDRLFEQTPEAFARLLLERGTRRVCFVGGPSGRLEASVPWLAPLAQALAALPDTGAHEAVFLEVGPRTGCLFSATLHSTARGQALGGVRHWPYPSLAAFLRDGLRLARGMTRKNALAGLWWGGGKGVIARAPGTAFEDPEFRRTLYHEYGAFVTGLAGCYVTAEDAGTTPADMAAVQEATRFVTCAPPDVGGSGNPSLYTAAGVVCAMRAAWDALESRSLEGLRIAMQGAGNVGAAMIELLLEQDVAGIRVAELSGERRRAVLDRFGGERVEVVQVEAEGPGILAAPCDVLVPNALGSVLGPKTIPHVRARLVCGAANNPLEEEIRDGAALHARGVAYVPDFLANRMGVVHCANEQYGVLPHDPAVERHLSDDWAHAIAPTTRRVLARAADEGIPPVAAAHALADELAAQPHPIWPGRGRTIVERLLAGGWAGAV